MPRRGTENFKALFPTKFELLTKKNTGGPLGRVNNTIKNLFFSEKLVIRWYIQFVAALESLASAERVGRLTPPASRGLKGQICACRGITSTCGGMTPSHNSGSIHLTNEEELRPHEDHSTTWQF